VADPLPDKIRDQIANAELPTDGKTPFKPKLVKNRAGKTIIDKKEVTKGPGRGKRGYVDEEGRIWVRDYGHVGYPDHWDVQINGGEEYIRVGLDGDEVIPDPPQEKETD